MIISFKSKKALESAKAFLYYSYFRFVITVSHSLRQPKNSASDSKVDVTHIKVFKYW